MGNAGSSNVTRERLKSNDVCSVPNSPFRELSIQESGGNDIDNGISTDGADVTMPAVLSFDKKSDFLHGGGSSQEDEESTYEPYYTKPLRPNEYQEEHQQQQSQQQQCTSKIIDPDYEFNVLTARKRLDTEELEEMATTLDTLKRASENDDNDNEKNVQSTLSSNIRPPTLPTVLRWDGGGRNVMISGTFTKWQPIPMVRSHGNFVTIIDLPEGDHQYKFCVDGEWLHDPKMKCIENENGETTNVVTVRHSDFEVFEALAKDGEQSGNQSEKTYSQEVPQMNPWEKTSVPPILPPHLLQVILNKDTPLSCEPTLLPEPNHVMLNHLYALSIKDGVMVLSATHRYRKKYVTTLLYKPI